MLGFCDASGRAYGAVIYIKSGENVALVASKNRVSRLKETLTMPRLELMGALLLAELFAAVKLALKREPSESFLFTDSEIVLSWLKNRSLTFKTFVSHRATKIVKITGREVWRHVRSEENPSDILSRGCSADKFLSSALWWHGPEWAKSSVEDFPKGELNGKIELNQAFIEEIEETIICASVVIDGELEKLTRKISNWQKLIRIVAYCERCIFRTTSEFLHIAELHRAERVFQICTAHETDDHGIVDRLPFLDGRRD